MSRRGLHTALAAAGVLLGLPLAAVVQWNREPPRVMWSSVPEWFSLRGPKLYGSVPPGFVRFTLSPGGARITSVEDLGWHASNGSLFLLEGVIQSPPVLLTASSALSTPSAPYLLHFDPPLVVEVDGVAWHRVTTEQPMTR